MSQKAKFPTVRSADIEGLGVVSVLESEPDSVMDKARSGGANEVSAALRHLADKLARKQLLTTEEAEFLVEGLTLVAVDVQRNGKPFGYRRKLGRPGALAFWKRMRVARAVDKLHDPIRNGLNFPPMPLEDNSSGQGSYAYVADHFKLTDATVRRAYAWYKGLSPG